MRMDPSYLRFFVFFFVEGVCLLWLQYNPNCAEDNFKGFTCKT